MKKPAKRKSQTKKEKFFQLEIKLKGGKRKSVRFGKKGRYWSDSEGRYWFGYLTSRQIMNLYKKQDGVIEVKKIN